MEDQRGDRKQPTDRQQSELPAGRRANGPESGVDDDYRQDHS
jgi:hypothetical protein